MPILGGTLWELDGLGGLEYSREAIAYMDDGFWHDLSPEDTKRLMEYLAANIPA